VVASDVGGIPEVVADGETGLLVHYDDRDIQSYRDGLAAAISRLLADPGLAAMMGTAARKRAVTEFAWTGVAARTVDVYRALG
ncbi:MAG: glycosyltransferase, partial [Kutzneria sp.]|nr:glycosyltransferase [Kutzneria sp.]